MADKKKKAEGGGVEDLREKAYWAIQEKLRQNKKLTAADYDFIREFEGERAAEQTAAEASREFGPEGDLEDHLEEWTVRDGVVGDRVVGLGALAGLHQVEREEVEKLLCKVQRGLLQRYGFEGRKRSGQLTGAERQALQWVKSIEQLARASQEWELQMGVVRQRRADGGGVDLETFQAMVETMKKLTDRRDALVLKVRELGMKERRAGDAKTGGGGMVYQIVVKN